MTTQLGIIGHSLHVLVAPMLLLAHQNQVAQRDSKLQAALCMKIAHLILAQL
ncbi:MAG: hypothetical protein ACRC7P_04800 [Enterovibrio sp.]